MYGIKIEVTDNIVRVIERPARITAGTVGLPVEFSFGNQWEGLSKAAVFRAGCVEMFVENIETQAAIPWEVLEKPDVWLSVGVYGVNADGSVSIPTIWANVGVIRDSADLGVSPAPTPPVWQRIWNAIGNLTGLATNAKDNLVEAINEVNSIALAGGIESDPTLSQSGKAADAKATGDALAQKAPAGYGLGGASKLLTAADDLNNIKGNGWYWWNFNDRPQNAPGEAQAYHMNVMRVWSQVNDTYGSCCQELMDVTDSLYHGVKMQRTIYGQSHYPWEWVNPPMMLGCEYRTTKRHNGKPVWATFQNCGPMPSSGDEIVYISALNIDDIVSFSAYMTNADHTDQYALPFGNLYYAAVRHDRVYKKTCEGDISSYNCYVTLEYTKTTD